MFRPLLTANRLVLQSAKAALNPAASRTVWQRLPVWPGVVGRTLVRSQAPSATRKFTAPTSARPAASDIAADVVTRFAAQQDDAAVWMRALDEGRAARAIMTSPFVRVVTYSVLDACRLILAHDRRHFEQARRVRSSPGFPA